MLLLPPRCIATFLLRQHSRGSHTLDAALPRIALTTCRAGVSGAGPRRHPLRPVTTASLAPGGPKTEMDPAVEQTVERIHCSPMRIVLYLGGGASQVGGAGPEGWGRGCRKWFRTPVWGSGCRCTAETSCCWQAASRGSSSRRR